ncbi:MAG: formyltransferase family protein, partial [Clostridia bacterium]
MKIAFFGTPELARTALKSIHDAGYEVCLVVTRADKPKGRGNKIAFSPVKEYAIEKNIQVFQPISLKTPEVFDFLKQQNADIFITAAYGRIFPKEILNIP